MIRRYSTFLLLVALIALSSCHAKKAVMRSEPVQTEAPRPGITQLEAPRPNIAEKYAKLLGVNPSQLQNGRLYDFIDQWMGTPYRFGGLEHDGIDCSGLAQLLELQVYGINIPRTTSQQVLVIKRKYEDELQEGDLLFFDYDGKQFSHVGVYLQNGYYVHASATKGVIIVKLHDPYIYKYFSRCGSVREAANVEVNR